MAKSVVSIVKGTDAEKMAGEALSLIGGVSSLIKPGSVVVVKPNAVYPLGPERSASTSPAFVSAAIKELRKAQPKEIIMAESSSHSTDSLYHLEVSGIAKAAREAGVEKIIDIKKDKDLIKIPIRDHRSELEFLLLPRFLIEADHIVNLPIFKMHVGMMYSCALKNMKGIVQADACSEMHQTNLGAAIMDLWSICKADLQMVDMIRPMEGYGPGIGMPIDFGCVVAGKDPVAVDNICCRMVGLDITKVPAFESIRERGLGKYEEKDIDIRGRKIEEVFKKLQAPYLAGWDQYPEYKVYTHEGSCEYCEGLVMFSLERLKSLDDEYKKNAGMSIVLGRAKELPKGVKPRDLVLFGNCIPEKFRDQGLFVSGCPPGEVQPAWAIMDRQIFERSKQPRDWLGREMQIFIDYVTKRSEKR